CPACRRYRRWTSGRRRYPASPSAAQARSCRSRGPEPPSLPRSRFQARRQLRRRRQPMATRTVRILVSGVAICLMAFVGRSALAGNDRTSGLSCAGKNPTIVGTAGNDVLVGTPGPDVIAGLEGDDVIDGQDGDDTLCGNEGQDQLLGGPGGDVFRGG